LPTETRLFDYDLPPELIAQVPLENRERSRLLVIHRDTGEIEHRMFTDIIEYVRPGDLFVANDTRVFPARLFVKKPTGANIELLFLKPVDKEKTAWNVLARPGRRLREGTSLFHDSLSGPFCRLAEKHENGSWTAEALPRPLIPFLEKYGVVPLPPYIKESISDPNRYQTIYAEKDGSAAAPTAGLHFTAPLIRRIEKTGASFTKVTLHIGLDTFKPVSAEFIEDHQMHSETYCVTDDAARAVAGSIRGGGRVVAVGTTAVRALESWAAGRPRHELARALSGGEGDTNLFIRRRSQFFTTDALLTNFHLPRSTLLILVSAFAGHEIIRRAYEEAIRERYRFYSFGDAMLIL